MVIELLGVLGKYAFLLLLARLAWTIFKPLFLASPLDNLPGPPSTGSWVWGERFSGFNSGKR